MSRKLLRAGLLLWVLSMGAAAEAHFRYPCPLPPRPDHLRDNPITILPWPPVPPVNLTPTLPLPKTPHVELPRQPVAPQPIVRPGSGHWR